MIISTTGISVVAASATSKPVSTVRVVVSAAVNVDSEAVTPSVAASTDNSVVVSSLGISSNLLNIAES